MKTTIKKRGPILANTLAFIVLSFFFLHVVTCLSHDVSSFYWTYLLQNILRFKILILTILFATVYIWKLKPSSSYFLLLITTLVTLESFVLIFEEFNKLILFLLFFYIVISYYFYQIWNNEIEEPYYNANYDEGDLFQPMLFKIKVKVISDEFIETGILTNWNYSGLFIYLDKALEAKPSSNVKLAIEINHNGKTFKQQGSLITYNQDLRGLGLKFDYLNSDQHSFNWMQINEIFEDLGYVPGYLT